MRPVTCGARQDTQRRKGATDVAFSVGHQQRGSTDVVTELGQVSGHVEGDQGLHCDTRVARLVSQSAREVIDVNLFGSHQKLSHDPLHLPRQVWSWFVKLILFFSSYLAQGFHFSQLSPTKRVLKVRSAVTNTSRTHKRCRKILGLSVKMSLRMIRLCSSKLFFGNFYESKLS